MLFCLRLIWHLSLSVSLSLSLLFLFSFLAFFSFLFGFSVGFSLQHFWIFQDTSHLWWMQFSCQSICTVISLDSGINYSSGQQKIFPRRKRVFEDSTGIHYTQEFSKVDSVVSWSIDAVRHTSLGVPFRLFSSLLVLQCSKFIQSESATQDDVMCGLMTVELEATQRRACVTSDWVSHGSKCGSTESSKLSSVRDGIYARMWLTNFRMELNTDRLNRISWVPFKMVSMRMCDRLSFAGS